MKAAVSLLAGLAFAKSQETIMAVTESVICPFERGHMAELVARHPRIGVALMALDQISRVDLNDRLAAVGRTSAKARVAALLPRRTRTAASPPA